MLTIFSSAKRKGWVVNDGLIGTKITWQDGEEP